MRALILIILTRMPFLLLLLGVVPYLLGLFLVKDKNHPDALIRCYAYGMAALFAVFEVFCVPMSYCAAKLSTLLMVSGAAVLALAVCSAAVFRGRALDPLKVFYAAARRRLTLRWGLLMAAMVLAMLAATLLVHDNAYANVGDELYHFPAMNEAVAHDLIWYCDPSTGRHFSYELGPGTMPWRRMVGGENTFFACLSMLLRVKPAVLCQTLVVPFMISWCYCAFWLLCRAIVPEDGGRMRMLFALTMLCLVFMRFNSATVSVAIFARAWQGRGLLYAVIFPLIWEGFIREDLSQFLLLNTAAVTLTTMGVLFLVPLELLIYAVCAVYRRRLISPAVFATSFTPQILAVLLLFMVGYK